MSSSVSHALQVLELNWVSALVATGVIAELTIVVLVLYYPLTHIIFAMARDGLVFVGKPEAQTPVRVIVLCSLLGIGSRPGSAQRTRRARQ